MTGLSQILGLEQALGVMAGHDATVAFIEQSITDLERNATRSTASGS